MWSYDFQKLLETVLLYYLIRLVVAIMLFYQR